MLSATVAATIALRKLTFGTVLAEFTLSNDNGHSQVPLELVLFALLGVCCGALSRLYKGHLQPRCQKLFDGLADLGVPRALHPMLGGLCAGCCAWALCPEVLFMGWANFKRVLLHPELFSV